MERPIPMQCHFAALVVALILPLCLAATATAQPTAAPKERALCKLGDGDQRTEVNVVRRIERAVEVKLPDGTTQRVPAWACTFPADPAESASSPSPPEKPPGKAADNSTVQEDEKRALCLVGENKGGSEAVVLNRTSTSVRIRLEDGTTMEVPAWLCSAIKPRAERRTEPAPAAAPTESGAPAASRAKEPVKEPESGRSWTVGGQMAFSVFARHLRAQAYRASDAVPPYKYKYIDDTNRLFLLDRALTASVYGEIWGQRLETSFGTSAVAGSGDAGYKSLGLAYLSRFLRVGTNSYLAGLYVFDQSSLSKDVNRIIEVQGAGYKVRSHAFGLVLTWDQEFGARNGRFGIDVPSALYKQGFVGLSAISFRNEVTRSREELSTGVRTERTLWFENRGVWPVLSAGIMIQYVTKHVRAGFGMTILYSLFVPISSWVGDSQESTNTFYQVQVNGMFEARLQQYVSLGVELRGVMNQNSFKAAGTKEGFDFKESRFVGLAYASVRY